MDDNDSSDMFLTRQLLSDIVEYHDELRGTLGTVKFYAHLAEQLSRLAGHKPAWSWRYVQGVHRGTIGPSEAFQRATAAYGATLDDAPAATTYTVQVTVLARPGAIPENGTLVLGEAKPCAWPGCRVIFVPRVSVATVLFFGFAHASPEAEMSRPRTRNFCCRCGVSPRSSPWSSYCDPCRSAVEKERKARSQINEAESALSLGLAISEPVLTWDGYGAEFGQWGKRKKCASAHFGRPDVSRVGGDNGA